MSRCPERTSSMVVHQRKVLRVRRTIQMHFGAENDGNRCVMMRWEVGLRGLGPGGAEGGWSWGR